MSPPKPAVLSCPAVVVERHSLSPASDTIQPPSSAVTSSSPTPPAAAAIVDPTAAEDAAGKLDDLETELELDLENMKLDNIDTTVGRPRQPVPYRLPGLEFSRLGPWSRGSVLKVSQSLS